VVFRADGRVVSLALGVALIGWTLGRGEPAHSERPVSAPQSPMIQLVQSTDTLQASLRRSYPAWSPEAGMQRSLVRRLVGGSMDYGEISRRALGGTWVKLSDRDRSEFVASLGKLIESRYRTREAYVGPDFRLRFEKEAVSTHGTASVFATLSGRSRGKPLQMAIEYRLLWKGDRWVVYDLVTDGESLLETYRDMFDRIIGRESFGGLLRRIKRQADEGDRDE
jgi:phospholipid transport system substrate-binding protein